MPIISGGGGGGAGAVAPLTLTGTADEVQLTVKGGPGQNHNVQEWLAPGGGTLASVDEVGGFSGSGAGQFGSTGLGNARRLTVDGTGNTTQDVVQVKDKNGTASAGVNVDGAIWTTVGTAPPDASFFAARLMLWYDPTPGAAKLMVKAKDTNGTFVTAAIALA